MLPEMEIIMPQQSLGNVPAFLAKLWKMVDNPETDDLISWSEEGTSFIIKNQPEFARSLLPYYYKHSNMASFVRQLNMYGFHKVMSVESGGLKGDKDEIEFAHPYFIRGQDHLLDQIKRKVSVNTRGSGISQQFIPSIKSEKVNEVLYEVGALKERQEDLDGKLDTMRSENEALWGEVLSLRQKHNQQQKIVNKLIQFLVALVQPRGMKRSFSRGVPGLQLAIEDVGEGPSAKHPKKEDVHHGPGPVIQEIQEGMTGSQLSELLNNAPVGTLHEITVTAAAPVEDQPPPTPQQANIVEMEPVQNTATTQPSKYRLVDPASVNSSLIHKRPVLHREISKEDFDTDISSMQKDLDNLKEMLSGQITLDTSLVSSLFSSDTDTLNGMNLFNENLLNHEEETTLLQPGEVKPVTYNPSFFELTEDNDSEDMMHTPKPSPFDVDLNTPKIQEDAQDPMKRFFKK